MFEVLECAEQALPDLLKSLDGWHSLDVNYEPPRVERLWREFPVYSGETLCCENYRLYLHRIHPCEKALYHPHPWPSIIKILAGGYEMAVGFGEGDKEPPLAATLKLAPGTVYEMTHRDGWHYVLPSVPNLSIMITGAPWERWSPGPGSEVTLGPLSEAAAVQLLEDFQAVYADYSRIGAGLVVARETAARHVSALRKLGLHEKANHIQYDPFATCRLCHLGTSGDKHTCWTEVGGKIVFLPDA